MLNTSLSAEAVVVLAATVQITVAVVVAPVDTELMQADRQVAVVPVLNQRLR
jgi:hypothetical protein